MSESQEIKETNVNVAGAENKKSQEKMSELNETQQALVSRLLKNLHEGIVEFTYKKKDGSTRKARGTLIEDLLPEKAKDSKRSSTNTDVCIYYFDLDSDGWRACRKENLISVR